MERMMRGPLFAVAAGVLAISSGSTHVRPFGLVRVLHATKIGTSDAAAGDNFGLSVAVSGHTTVVGARFDDTSGGNNAGSAYVFVRSGSAWVEQAHFAAPDGNGDANFGVSVAISGNSIVVGAQWNDPQPGLFDAGSAYVFDR